MKKYNVIVKPDSYFPVVKTFAKMHDAQNEYNALRATYNSYDVAVNVDGCDKTADYEKRFSKAPSMTRDDALNRIWQLVKNHPNFDDMCEVWELGGKYDIFICEDDSNGDNRLYIEDDYIIFEEE